jgi:apolipoprotein N-acyltransferase
MKIWSKTRYADVSAIALGVLLTFAFAPFEIFPLAILAPAALLALWLNATPKTALRLGFLFGVGLFTSGAYWLYTAIHVYGFVDIYLTIIIMIGFVFILSAYPALVGYICARNYPLNRTANLLFAFPVVWVAAEWVRGWLFSGFPWLFLGYSQINSPLKGYAPIFSVYGVSLAVVFTSALLINAYKKFQQKNIFLFCINIFVIICIWLSGALLNLIQWTTPAGRQISVSLIKEIFRKQ